jgi:hypothetical protein
MRKYEIYLPLKYNDGKAIESDKIVGVWDELADAFGGITVSPLSAPYQEDGNTAASNTLTRS